jgi:hypothetical protein
MLVTRPRETYQTIMPNRVSAGESAYWAGICAVA